MVSRVALRRAIDLDPDDDEAAEILAAVQAPEAGGPTESRE
jgi:hypothetical protein